VGRTSATRGTYRSVLRKYQSGPRGPGATRFAGSLAPPPYSLAERGELWAMASAQRPDWRRRSALALICCCIGAGLRAGELVSVQGCDVICQKATTSLRVGGSAARLIRLVSPYDAVIGELARQGGACEHLFHPGPADRSYKNFVNSFCAHLVADPSSPAVSVPRCRSSFICDHLARKTPLSVIVEIAGLKSVESLRRHALYVQGVPRTNAGLRRALLKEQAS
jgi:integrase